jgi:hypothetical protein
MIVHNVHLFVSTIYDEILKRKKNTYLNTVF